MDLLLPAQRCESCRVHLPPRPHAAAAFVCTPNRECELVGHGTEKKLVCSARSSAGSGGVGEEPEQTGGEKNKTSR